MSKASRLHSLVSLRNELDRYTIFTAAAAFTVLAAAVATGGVDLPGGTLLLALVPLGMFLGDLARPDRLLRTELRGAAAWCALVLVAFALVPFLTSSALIAAGLPFALGVAVVVARWPAAATVVALFLTGVLGTFTAFIGFGPGPILDVILVAIWLVLFARVVLGRTYRFVIWPAVLGCGLFIGLTAIDMITSDDLGRAWFGFRTTVWYMLSFIALAYAGWSRDTYRRIAIGFIAVTAIVAAYTTLRWVIGPAGAERTLAEIAGGGINVDPVDKSLRTVGSFPTAHQLGFWTAFMAPFCVAVALWVRGWRRLLAVGAVALCVAAMIASEVRGPLPGFIAGTVLILAIYQVSRAFPGFKAGIALLAILVTAGASGAIFALSETDPERLDRYRALVEPGSDPTFIQRQNKWELVMPEIEEYPFGHGLGSGGAAQRAVGSTVELSEFAIDNSYLMIAYEQGLLVMVIFIAVMLGLLVSLVVASMRTRSRQGAALGMGACGALLSMLVSFYTGLYIEAAVVPAAWLVIGVGLAYFVAEEAPAPETEQPTARPAGSPPAPAPAPAMSAKGVA